MHPPAPEHEARRIQELARAQLMDSPATPEFDDFVLVCCDIFDVEIATISFLDAQREWFKSATGLVVQDIPREASFSHWVVANDSPLHVPDALQDPRFKRNRLVLGPPFVRFFSAVPVHSANGLVLGALCLADSQPRHLTESDVEMQLILAKQVEALVRKFELEQQCPADIEMPMGSPSVLEDSEQVVLYGNFNTPFNLEHLSGAPGETLSGDFIQARLEHAGLLKAIHRKDIDRVQRYYERWLASDHEQDAVYVYRFRTPGQDYRWVQEQLSQRSAHPAQFKVTLTPVERQQARHVLATEVAQSGVSSMVQFRLGSRHLHIDYVSKNIADLVGVDAETLERSPRLLLAAIHPGDLEPVQFALAQAARENQPCQVELRILQPNTVCWFSLLARPTATHNGACIWNGSLIDITRSKAAEDKLLKAQKLANLGYWELDDDDDQLFISDTIYPMLNLDTEQESFSKTHILSFIKPEDRQPILESLAAARRCGNAEVDFQLQVENQPIGWVRQRTEYDYDNGVLFGTILDITSTKQLELELRRLTVTDPLTGLYNRRHFYQRASEELSLAKRESLPLSVIVFDIDNFKQVNDNYGHSVGDQVLVEVSKCLLAQMRKSDLLFRVGGEEFHVLLPNTGLSGASKSAEKLRQAVASCTISNSETSIRVTCSFGIAELKDADSHIDGILKRADAAMYCSKQSGKNKVLS